MAAQLLHHAINGGFPDKQTKGSRAGLECLAHLLEEAVIDPQIGQSTRCGTNPCPYSGPQQRVEKEQAHQCAPEPTTDRTGSGEVVGLSQLHLPLVLVHHHHGVL